MKRSSYWYIRLLTQHGTRPLVVGLSAFAVLLVIFFIWVAIVDWLEGGIHLSFSRLALEVSILALVGYSVGVTVHTLSMTPRDVLALSPALAIDQKSLADEAASITQQSSAIHIWTFCWVLTMMVLTWWVSGMPIDDNALARESSQPTIEGWTYFRNLIYVFTLSQLTWIDIALARRLGKLVEQHGRVNLLDRSALRALANRMRRNVLVWIPLLAHSIAFVVVVLAVVILPATGIRRRYVEEKNRQLVEVRTRIADRSAAVVDGSFTAESSSLPELVSWERRLQQVKVWPYDMTIYLRIFVYAAIGLSSWVGAALVERFIGAVFG